MKKYGKILIAFVVILLLSFPVLYKYVLFDDEPFDNIRTGEIESVFVIRNSDGKKVTVKNLSAFADCLEELELECRADYGIDEEESVKAFIYYRNGRLQTVDVSRFYIKIDDKLYKADYDSTDEFLFFAQSLMKD